MYFPLSFLESATRYGKLPSIAETFHHFRSHEKRGSMDTSGLLLAQNYHLCPSPFFSELSSNCKKIYLFIYFARNTTLFVEVTGWEDGKLASQNNHLLHKNFWCHCPIGPGIYDLSWPVQWRELILIYVCVCFLIEISLMYNIKLV